MTAIALLPAPSPLARPTLDAAREHAYTYAGKARSDATRSAYDRDFAAFGAWCASVELVALPAEPLTIATYIGHLAASGRKVATITRHLASLSIRHKRAGFDPSPTSHVIVRETVKGIRRDVGVAQRKAAPLIIEDLRRVVEPLGNGAADVRDRALLVLGFAAAFRRSELVGLDVEDLAFVRAGLEVNLRRSKTDQEGAGALIAVPFGSNLGTCPVRALRAWLDVTGATSGPVFRAVDRTGRVLGRRLCGRAVALIVQARALAAGVEGAISGHSLRAGFATTAANAGIALLDSMRQTRHKSIAVASGYVRRASAWDRNAAANVGL